MPVVAKDPHYGIPEQDPRLAPKHVWTIVPSTSDDQPYITTAIRSNEAGSMVVDMFGGEGSVTVRFAAGETRFMRVRKVRSMSGITNAEGMA